MLDLLVSRNGVKRARLASNPTGEFLSEASFLGRPRTSKRLARQAFVDSHYKPPRIVLNTTGDVKHGDLVKLAESSLGITQHGVHQLRKLLEPQQEEDVCGGSGYLPETVFVKGQQGPAEVGFEWEDVEEMVTIKQEVVGSNDEDEVEEGMEEVVGSNDDSAPRRKRTRVNWEVDPLTLAKAIPVRWNAKQESHWQSYQEDRTWTQLAAETELVQLERHVPPETLVF
ncbi:hypothetical protein quinque_008894 [Culex quinquefasciatus]